MNKVLLASYVVRSGAKTVMSINFVYLDECLRLLQNNKKSVMEDDTCFARIGTSIELLIGQDVHSDLAIQFINDDSSGLLTCCSSILEDVTAFQPSTTIFTLKIFAVISHELLLRSYAWKKREEWEDCFQNFLKIPIGEHVINQSLSFAWLQCFTELVKCPIALSVLMKAEEHKSLKVAHSLKKASMNPSNVAKTFPQHALYFSPEVIFQLMCNTSLFLSNQACDALSCFLVVLHGYINVAKDDVVAMKSEKILLSSIQQLLVSVENTCKVLSRCLRLRADVTVLIIESHMNGYFYQESVHQELMKFCKNCNSTLTDFIGSLPSQNKLLPMDLLREMALYSLFQFPLATNSYSLLCNVVFVIKEPLDLYYNLLIYPFDLLVEKSRLLAENIMLPWKEVLMKMWSASSQVLRILCHCASSLTKICLRGLLNDDNMVNIINLLVSTLSCIFEFEGPHFAARLGRGKIALVVVHSIYAIVQHLGRCVECVSDLVISLVFHLIEHPDSNHKLLEKAGQFLVKACGSSCAEHGNFNQRLIDILHQKMEHPCWKDRDSAMELLQSLLELQNDKKNLRSMYKHSIVTSGVHCTLLNVTSDSNSFVRSSALSTLSVLVKYIEKWDSEWLISLATVAFNMVKSDGEAVARRSATLVLCEVLKKMPALCDELINSFVEPGNVCHCLKDEKQREQVAGLVKLYKDVLIILSKDLDWEVRCNMIQLLSDFYDNASCSKEVEKWKVDAAFCTISALLEPLLNCLDREVSERAADLLAQFNGEYNVSVIEQRKNDLIVEELNGLMHDVIFRLQGDDDPCYDTEHQIDPTDLDCY